MGLSGRFIKIVAIVFISDRAKHLLVMDTMHLRQGGGSLPPSTLQFYKGQNDDYSHCAAADTEDQRRCSDLPKVTQPGAELGLQHRPAGLHIPDSELLAHPTARVKATPFSFLLAGASICNRNCLSPITHFGSVNSYIMSFPWQGTPILLTGWGSLTR